MIKISTFTLIMLFLISCNQGESKERKPLFEKTDTISNATKTISSKTIKSIPIIFDRIKSVYNLDESQLLNTIVDWPLSEDQKRFFGPQWLDLSEVKNYFYVGKYRSHQFLIFTDSIAAKKQFDQLVRISSLRRSNRSDGLLGRYEKVFSKAGSTYIRYNELIIYHERTCAESKKFQNTQEDKIIQFLYDHKPPKEPYFVSVHCGWTFTRLE